MDWYFILSHDSPLDVIESSKVAVTSAYLNTKLKPHLIYLGNKNDAKLSWFYKNKVNIICYKMSDNLKEIITPIYFKNRKKQPEHLEKFSLDQYIALFTRIEIPLLTKKPYILYTDYDIIFRKGLDDLSDLHPEYFAATIDHDPRDWSYINAGVLFINCKILKKNYNDFINYIRNNITTEWINDQTAINEFYKNKITYLSPEYNWKPHWGINEGAKIIHFIGELKPKYELDNNVIFNTFDSVKYYRSLYKEILNYVK